LLVYRFYVIGNEDFFDLEKNNVLVIAWFPLELSMKCLIEPCFIFFEVLCKQTKPVDEKDK
jgi:hypothetical protein